jgi:uncharacterized membrane protein
MKARGEEKVNFQFFLFLFWLEVFSVNGIHLKYSWKLGKSSDNLNKIFLKSLVIGNNILVNSGMRNCSVGILVAMDYILGGRSRYRRKIFLFPTASGPALSLIQPHSASYRVVPPVLKLTIFHHPLRTSKMMAYTFISPYFFVTSCLIKLQHSQIKSNERQKIATDLEVDATIMH